MADVPAALISGESVALARVLGREMARAHLAMISYYRESLKPSPAEAEARARGEDDTDLAERLRHADVRQISWWDWSSLLERDESASWAVWDRIAAEASDDLDSGNRAASALEFEGSPFERARFLVLRDAFRRDWQPRGGIESSLVDVLAQTYSTYEFWLTRLHQQSVLEGKRSPGVQRADGKWSPPSLSIAEALEQSAAMVDRFNRLFLRTLRTLRDLRRTAVPVVVENGGQLNIGERQINVGR